MPDKNPDKENRKPNDISASLEITDSWVIFVKPRSSAGLIKDIGVFKKKLEESKNIEGQIPNLVKKFVTEPSDKKLLPTNSGIVSGEGCPSSSNTPSTSKQKLKLFFPKASNEQQDQIIERLEVNDGVVVQGPPGTGKTHTIANIICHYLATGRRVLVTSKGEPALSVLQEQIPQELRNLTISYLTSERQGIEQLEAAVRQLSTLVNQTNRKELVQEVETNASRIRLLEQRIEQIDGQIKELALKQHKRVNQKLTGKAEAMTPMKLAELVVNNNTGAHNWLTDKLGSSNKYTPQFTNFDIAEIRDARRCVGASIVYVGKTIPNIQDMPDNANVEAMHNDLSKSAKIMQGLKSGSIPPLNVSVNNAINRIERAKKIKKQLQDCSKLLRQLKHYDWLKRLYGLWIDGIEENDNGALFNELLSVLSDLMRQRQQFVKNYVELPDPSSCLKGIKIALENLRDEKKAFALWSFGKKEEKKIIKQARIDGEIPINTKQWQLVLDYIKFQDSAKKFVKKWNYLSKEIGWSKFDEYTYGSLFKEISDVYELIKNAKQIASQHSKLKKEVSLLFPSGINADRLGEDQSEIDKTIEAIELNISYISLYSQRIKLKDLIDKLKESSGDITKEIKEFFTKTIGNLENNPDIIITKWKKLTAELRCINELSSNLQLIENIAGKISDSGARIWSKKLKSEPLLASEEDKLTPPDWYKTWQHNRQKQYLDEIDGRYELKQLSENRSDLDGELKCAFLKLIERKTKLALHESMTESVQSALMRFVSAASKIGKGKGKRAPRYRKELKEAMQKCYSSVPCWIMPTWRVSESMPSDFGSFDLVIIDEASQSDITALPTILRAKKLLIVGDDKQVSPTAAFVKENKMNQLKHNFLKEQPFAALLLPEFSIYELASAVFPSQIIMLTEHFRCVEPIIRFSMQFYDNQLIPLRIPKASEKIVPPLVNYYVKGARRDEVKEINEIEAEAIVEEITNLVTHPQSKYKGRSIGVVSLIGAKQAKYIQEKLLKELGEEIFQDHKIACGDAATFQGKERDIMFLSMVVGTGQSAVMSIKSAEQRMNVALSRARDRMYLYRSIQESELKNENDLRLKILRHFKNPMPQQKQADNAIELCESGFEKDVYQRLINKEYHVTPQVKVGAFSIDLVVEGENDKRLAVELDGDQYHPPEQWEKDWKRQRIMERVGWTFWRCWGSSYIINPEGCINELIDRLNSMQIFPHKGSASANIYVEHRVYEQKIIASEKNLQTLE